jgi:hypothetical protein
MSVIGLTFLWLIWHGDSSPTATAAPSLRPLVPSSSLIRCQPVQVCYHHHSFSLSAGKRFESGQCSSVSGSYSVCSLFFHFGGGQPLHNVQSLIFCSLMEVLTVFFANSNLWVCPLASYNVSLLPRHGSHLLLHPLMLLPVILSFLRCSCHLALRFLMPLLHSGLFHRLFSDISPLWPCPLHCAGMSQQVIRLLVAANFCWDPPSPWVHFFGCRLRPTARFRSPYWSSSASTVSTAATSLRTMLCYRLHFFQAGIPPFVPFL